MESVAYLIPLFFVTAVVYASVGFGGGSTYLALLVLSGIPYGAIPKLALICNLIVVTGGLYHYLRQSLLPYRRVLPFILTSVPLAYLGGSIPLDKRLFLTLLAISLAIAGLRLLLTGYSVQSRNPRSDRTIWGLGLSVGALLGFVSGLVGIGGGIFLSPLLYFLRWGSAREIAAMSSMFIFVNSLSGLVGQFSKSGLPLDLSWILPLVLAVFVGGQIGSRLSAGHLRAMQLQRITAVLILFVSARIFWTFL